MFISNAYAQVPGLPTGTMESLGQILPLVVMFLLAYFMIIRPQLKRSKEHKTMVDALQKGDEVAAGGLLGKITKVGDNFVSVEIADNVIVSVQKHAVTQLLPKGTVKASQ